MSGETRLGSLLAHMQPVLDPGEFVFLSLDSAGYGDHARLQPVAACVEPEGLTLVAPRENAAALGFDCDRVFRRITLGVHSSLEAVGLTAAFASALAERDISANVIAGYYHDHIFVPVDLATRAMQTLTALASGASAAQAGPNGKGQGD